MNLRQTPGGKIRYDVPQGNWQRFDRAFFTANFAGHEMIALRVDDEHQAVHAWELRFIGYVTGGFATVMAAKESGSTFAKAVLETLIKSIR